MAGSSKTFAALAGAAAALVCLSMSPGANGHISQLEPTSRPVWNSKVFQEWPFEPMEYCPHCMNANGPKYVKPRAIEKTDPEILAEYGDGEWPLLAAWEKGEIQDNGNYIEIEELAVRHGFCGDPKQNKTEDWNFYSTPNKEWPILTTYQEGGVMDMKVIMSAYHWGHLEFCLCNADDLEDPEGVATQSCCNKNPLTRTVGDDMNSPIDPTYPGRYYVDPECREEETDQEKPEGAAEGYVMHMKYDLPKALTCKRCVLQMTYYTGNACKHVGYDEFEPTSWPSKCAPNKEDWIELNRKICGEEDAYPEEFWACSDIAITSDGEPNPTPAPTSAIPECPEPVEPFEQCGGTDWTGSECCRAGYECTQMGSGSCYSQCRQIPDGCSENWKQCGGTTKDDYWDGPTCCWPGATCVYKSKYFSTCQPDDWVPEDADTDDTRRP